MKPTTLTLLATIAAATLTTGCQNWRNPTTKAPADTNTTPLAETAPEAQPPLPPDNSIPTPRPVTASVASADPATPTPRKTDTPTPAPTADPNNPTAPTRVEIAPDRATGRSTLPAAATGPIAPATAPAATGPVERAPRSYVAADADEATLLRNWPVSVNYVPSGHAVAGPVYRVLVPPPRSNGKGDVYVQDLAQTVATIPQMFATPFWMFVTPPWTPVEYHGDQFPPTYTANDYLPYYVDEKVPGIVQMKR